jgi:hypothetical protein
MKRAYLARTSIIPDGAFGNLSDWRSIPFCLTIERTFENGQPVIPPGVYECHKRMYHRGGYMTFEIPLAGHSDLLIHKMNLETESRGCIGLGEEFGLLHGKPAILRSGLAFDEFWVKYGDEDCLELVITEYMKVFYG